MLRTVALAISIAVFLYIGYILVRAYRPAWFKRKHIETFVQRPMGPPIISKINSAPVAVPAAAPPVTQPPPEEPRVVAPGGPGTPNATALPDVPPTISPEAKPVDPYDDKNMEAPIHDSMRFPELSFGPGVENKGTKNAASSGVANARGVTSESPFSPEFAQNGGIFMGSVSANDLSRDDTYATI
jgi:hypothetical protein